MAVAAATVATAAALSLAGCGKSADMTSVSSKKKADNDVKTTVTEMMSPVTDGMSKLSVLMNEVTEEAVEVAEDTQAEMVSASNETKAEDVNSSAAGKSKTESAGSGGSTPSKPKTNDTGSGSSGSSVPTSNPVETHTHIWKEQADKLSAEETSREDYDQWRYNYPKFDTTQHWAKVPSKELSDAFIQAFADKKID